MMEYVQPVKRKRGRPKKVARRIEYKTNVPLCPKPLSNEVDPAYLHPGIGKKSKSKPNHINVKNKNTAIRFKDKELHNLEEKRRKGKINQWINKLGDLVCTIPVEQRSKNVILEHTFQYIQNRQMIDTDSPKQDDLVKKLSQHVKRLESLVHVLVDVLKRNSIPVPSSVDENKILNVTVESNDIETASKSNTLTSPDINTLHSFGNLFSNLLENKISLAIPDTSVSKPRNVKSLLISSNQQALRNYDTAETLHQQQDVIPNTINDNVVSFRQNDLQNAQIFTSDSPPNHSVENTTVRMCGSSSALPGDQRATPQTVSGISVTRNLSTSSSGNVKITDLWRPIESVLDNNNYVSSTNASKKDITNVTFVRAASRSETDSSSCGVSRFEKPLVTALSEIYQHESSSTSSNPILPSLFTCKKNIVGNAGSTDALRKPPKIITSSQINLVSSMQTFGIDNILISSTPQPVPFGCGYSTPSALFDGVKTTSSSVAPFPLQSEENVRDSNTTSARTSTTVALSHSIPKSILNHEDIVSRSRIPSSGHTVAALLDVSENHKKAVILPSKDSSTAQSFHHTLITKSDIGSTNTISECDNLQTIVFNGKFTGFGTGKVIEEPMHEESHPSIDPSQLSNSKNSKRWENVLVNAQNSNILLTSFVIGKKALKRNKSTTKKKVLQNLSVTKKGETCEDILNVANENNLTDNDLLTNSLQTVCLKSNIVDVQLSSPQGRQTISSSQISPLDFTVSSIRNSGSTFETTLKGGLEPKNNKLATTISCTTSSTTASIPPAVTTPTKILVARTMSDRTVKNKWLEIDRKQEMHVTTKEIDMCQDQCASPVISYQNAVKRKRTNDNTMENLATSKHMAYNNLRDRDPNFPCVSSSSASAFSAESLCQSDRQKLPVVSERCDYQTQQHRPQSQKHSQEILHFYNRQQEAPQLFPQQQQQGQTSSFQNQLKLGQSYQASQNSEKLNHYASMSYSTSLPTILNIFAPAPVPSNNIHQTNMQNGNFSPEVLVNDTCQLNMMNSEMADSSYNENLLMTGNFTNFSADTLITESETSLTYAVENLLGENQPNQVANYWNQSPWLTHDVPYNESLYQISNLQNANPRNRSQYSSTEGSPIKSIISIIQSPQNTTNLPQQLNNLPSNVLQERFRQKKDEQESAWSDKSFSKPNISQNSSLMNFSIFQEANYFNKPLTQFHHASLNRQSSNQMGPAFLQQQHQEQNQHNVTFSTNNIQSEKNKHGPSFGKYSLINT